MQVGRQETCGKQAPPPQIQEIISGGKRKYHLILLDRKKEQRLRTSLQTKQAAKIMQTFTRLLLFVANYTIINPYSEIRPSLILGVRPILNRNSIVTEIEQHHQVFLIDSLRERVLNIC